ncbi:MAG: hypothetical protein LBK43_00420 [Treponema sp.]|jgi:hypothetical protein|nr:hypothetical protein [Treponema sp.]
MCKANKRFFVYLLLLSLVGVLQAQERESWYLISERELQSIATYKTTSETEKQTWLLQVQKLKVHVEHLQVESVSLNQHLQEARELQRRLTEFSKQYEAAQLTLLSLKHGEIASLNQEVTAKTQEAATYKKIAGTRLRVSIALGSAWLIFIGFKLCRLFKLF